MPADWELGAHLDKIKLYSFSFNALIAARDAAERGKKKASRSPTKAPIRQGFGSIPPTRPPR